MWQWSRTRPEERSEERQASSCLSFDCINTPMPYLKLYKDRVSNYETQNSRISRQNSTGMGKASKNDVFGAVLARLIEAGGGNQSALACNGNSTNDGAAQMTNLTRKAYNICSSNGSGWQDLSSHFLSNIFHFKI